MSLAAERLWGSAAPRPDLDTARVMARAGGENFPVAPRLLPRRLREDLLAIYGYARFVDELGDRADGGGAEQRLAELDWAEGEVDRALAGESTHEVFAAAGRLARSHDIDRRPFVDLIDANRMDQRNASYPDFEALCGYCALSANPVGRLVLAAVGVADPVAIERSDLICTGLQLVEHWQDVVEDYRAGRVYLPEADLEVFGVAPVELVGPVRGAMRRLVAFETRRAQDLLVAGSPLVGQLEGFARLAVAGFLGGGLAQIEAIEDANFDVFSSSPKAPRLSVARRALRCYVSGWS
jgi:squalene synthase HpnC